jgi:apolipoprotein N-acyltransferase
MLSRIANSVILAWGIRRAFLAFAMGALATLALEPFSIWPVMFISFTVLVWLVDGAAAGRWNGVIAAGVTGWWFAFGYFVAGYYWIGHAFLVDAKTFAWLMPFAVIGLPAVMAIYVGLGLALARLLWTRGAWRILTLAATMTIAEWLRGHVVTGFPWNAFGYGLTGPLTLAQGASVLGLWGMTFLAVAVFASPATLVDDSADTPRPWLAPACAALALVALAGFGAVRLSTTPTTYVEGVRLRIVQPNQPQDERFSYAAKASVMAKFIAMSDRATGPRSQGLTDVTHLIWPESSFPFFLTREPDAMADIANLLPNGTVLITGAARADEPDKQGRILRGYNSVYVIDHDGTILSIYDKVHLVPFGEYLPFQDVLERLGLMQLTKVQGGFIAGDRHRATDIPHAPRFLPLICYEIIFPGEGVPRGADRPDWLVNVTNDAWFGVSTGPYQHLQQARIRAIEEGLPLVRAANSGISAVADPLGRIIGSLPLGTEGVLDAGLPVKVEPTLYSSVGDRHIGLVLAIVLGLSTMRRRNAS